MNPEDFAILCELGSTPEQIAAHFNVSIDDINTMCLANWQETAVATSKRLRAGGPMHLLIKAYKQAEKDGKVLMYLLDKLWEPSKQETEVTEESAKGMSDKQLLTLIGKMT